MGREEGGVWGVCILCFLSAPFSHVFCVQGRVECPLPETWRTMALHYQTPHPQNPLWDDDNLVASEGLTLESETWWHLGG